MTAEATSTPVTAREALGEATLRPTRPSAPQAPMQRVQVMSSPIAACRPTPRGGRPSADSSTKGSRIQVPTFSLAITFESAKVAAPSGTSSAPRSGSAERGAETARPASSTP